MTGQTMRRLRRYHLYLGMIFAPAILFFAFSGLIQVIGWQDDDGSPRWIHVMANLHKHQWTSRPEPAGAAPRPRPAGSPPREHDAAPTPFIPLKPFVLLTALALLGSAVLGIVIALATPSTRRTSLAMLAIGTILPVALLIA